MRILLTFLFVTITVLTFGQSAHKYMRNGNSSYKAETYDKAEVYYRKSLDKQLTHKGNYNLGNSLHLQDEFEQAAKYYQRNL